MSSFTVLPGEEIGIGSIRSHCLSIGGRLRDRLRETVRQKPDSRKLRVKPGCLLDWFANTQVHTLDIVLRMNLAWQIILLMHNNFVIEFHLQIRDHRSARSSAAYLCEFVFHIASTEFPTSVKFTMRTFKQTPEWKFSLIRRVVPKTFYPSKLLSQHTRTWKTER